MKKDRARELFVAYLKKHVSSEYLEGVKAGIKVGMSDVMKDMGIKPEPTPPDGERRYEDAGDGEFAPGADCGATEEELRQTIAKLKMHLKEERDRRERYRKTLSDTLIDLKTAPQFIRVITTHYDGYSLNHRIEIHADPKTSGNASHEYRATIEDNGVGLPVLSEKFQKGPRHEKGSEPGITENVLLAILIDRLQGFQGSEYRCRENGEALNNCKQALAWLKQRADARAHRSVLGTGTK